MIEKMNVFYNSPVMAIIIFSTLLLFGILRAVSIVKETKNKPYLWKEHFSAEFFIILMTWPNTWMPVAKILAIKKEFTSDLAVLSVIPSSLLLCIFLIYGPFRIYHSLQNHFLERQN